MMIFILKVPNPHFFCPQAVHRASINLPWGRFLASSVQKTAEPAQKVQKCASAVADFTGHPVMPTPLRVQVRILYGREFNTSFDLIHIVLCI